ncbi:C-type lectin domain family 2 member B-like [Chlamydotis macqueenii]
MFLPQNGREPSCRGKHRGAERQPSVGKAPPNAAARRGLETPPAARRACQAAMAALFAALLVTAVAFAAQAFQPRPQPCLRCPFDWVGHRGKCYHFSEAEGNWTAGRDNCSALGASLATLDSVEDLSFVLRYKGTAEPWVGLSREDEEQPWEWVTRARFSHPFRIGGSGLCAHLNATGLSASGCGTARSWVCSERAAESPGEGGGARRARTLCASS